LNRAGTPVSAAIQAGGESQRMGQNKALMPFLGRPLIERVISRVKLLADEVLITTNQPELFGFLRLPLFQDLIPGTGALGGLCTALQSAHHSVVMVVGCDMPFVNPQLLVHQIDILLSDGLDVVIPKTVDGFEPLHSVYRRETCLPAIRHALESEQRRMISWFPEVKVRVLQANDIRGFDPDGRAFVNVNTPQEFAQVEALAKQLDDQAESARSTSTESNEGS
jgi:molybdopterin-guanine dinucleotide biosynthesis protein A